MVYNIKESGARIRQLRIQSGYTQEKLAGALNIDRSRSVDLLIQLSDFFDVSLDLLVLGKEKTAPGDNKRKLLKSSIAELINRLEALKDSL